jgi:hypothetical protein
MNFKHKISASGRWFEFSAAEQLGNIGSEVSRAISWQERNEPELQRQAFERALELFDLTSADKKWLTNHGRLKELRRMREVFCDYFYGNDYHTQKESLQNYFDQYALIARKRKLL